MEILGIGPLEALFVLLIALVVVGPRDLGKVARSAGRMLNRLYRSEAWRNLSEASRNLRTLPNRLAREAALEELDQVRRELREEVTREVRADLGMEPPPEPDLRSADDEDPTPPPRQASGPTPPTPADPAQDDAGSAGTAQPYTRGSEEPNDE